MPRDEFSASIKWQLAAAAGLICSNPRCLIYTCAPGQKDNIGEASHIAAASPGGARYDYSMTREYRASAANGIWLCRVCARLIDINETRYPIATLAMWKTSAESRARLRVRTRATHSTSGPSPAAWARLIEIEEARTTYDLFAALKDQPYSAQTTSAIRDQIGRNRCAESLLDMATELIIDCWNDDSSVAGLSAVMLSMAFDKWNPQKKSLSALHLLCRRDLDSRDCTRIGVVEPLAYALAAKKSEAMQTAFLRTAIEDDAWRDIDTLRALDYYGSDGALVVAVLRHLRDPVRQGLLKANDVGRLLVLLERLPPDLEFHGMRRLLCQSVHESASALIDSGHVSLAKSALQIAFSKPITGSV